MRDTEERSVARRELALPVTDIDPQSRRPALVLGLGNILLRDEGVGVRVIEALKELDMPPNVELCDGGTAGADLLDVLADREKVIVIDAVAGELPPGAVVRLTAEDLAPAREPSVSLHDFGLAETLALTRQIKAEPKEIVIIGVRPHIVECGLELAPETRLLVPRIVDLVLRELDPEQSEEA